MSDIVRSLGHGDPKKGHKNTTPYLDKIKPEFILNENKGRI